MLIVSISLIALDNVLFCDPNIKHSYAIFWSHDFIKKKIIILRKYMKTLLQIMIIFFAVP